MLKKTVIVTFAGPEHTGKTTLEAAFVKFLAEYGITVNMPPDAQRDDKMGQSVDELMSTFRDKEVTVLMMENNSSTHH